MSGAFSCDEEVLKTNEDYQKLLRTLALLEAQKIKAIEDLEKLQQLQANFQNNPDEVYKAFVQDQISGDVIPSRQSIATVPEIDWSKYHNESSLIAVTNYNTRKKKNNVTSTKDELGPLTSPCTTGRDARKCKKTKSISHGQAWTEEEQRRLEELLKIYPSEEVEAKRWQKIAKALGNRTTKQVCCRVQKYFIKLAKAGLPVPGRTPNLAVYSKKSKVRRSSTRQPSLFFNSLKPKVYMPNNSQDSDESLTSSDGFSSEEDYEDQRTMTIPFALPNDYAASFDCSGCHCKLESIYWQCNECGSGIKTSTGTSTDTSTGASTPPMVFLCLECVKNNWSNGSHNTSHEMVECLVSTSKENSATHNIPPNQYLDSDYTIFEQSSSTLADYNYLDPNFCPAL